MSSWNWVDKHFEGLVSMKDYLFVYVNPDTGEPSLDIIRSDDTQRAIRHFEMHPHSKGVQDFTVYVSPTTGGAPVMMQRKGTFEFTTPAHRTWTTRKAEC